MRKILFVIALFIFLPLILSCSHADDVLKEYILEVERTIKDTTTNNSTPNDSTNNDSLNKPSDNNTTNIVVVVKDTIKLSYEKYMQLTPSYGTGQGAACYGKYLFQGYSNNAVLGVYDLEKKTVLCKLDIPGPEPTSSTHANTVNFGNERVSPDDYFPLLYISSGYTKKINGSSCSFIYVYRISKYNNSDGTEGFYIEFVQTITLKGFGSWTEGILDNEHNLLWIKYEPDGTDGEYRYASFHIPKLENGDITILREDFITDFSLGVQPFKSSNQGHLFNDNKILLVSGTSLTSQKLAFIIINTLTQTRELVLDLASIGLTNEPENLFYYNNQLMIGYRGAIYKFQLSPLSKN